MSDKKSYEERYRTWKEKDLTDEFRNYSSISKYLKSKNLTDETFEYKLSKIPLEDIIALKLELCAKALKSKMFGFKIWKKSDNIMRDALLKFALSVTQSKREASELLGLDRSQLYDYIKRFDLKLFLQD